MDRNSVMCWKGTLYKIFGTGNWTRSDRHDHQKKSVEFLHFAKRDNRVVTSFLTGRCPFFKKLAWLIMTIVLFAMKRNWNSKVFIMWVLRTQLQGTDIFLRYSTYFQRYNKNYFKKAFSIPKIYLIRITHKICYQVEMFTEIYTNRNDSVMIYVLP